MLPDRLDGVLLLHLQFEDSNWLHRRVDRVSFLDDSRYRHHVSIDFDVHDAAVVQTAATFLKDRSRFIVPLGLMAKRPLTSFDLVDASGASRSLLTSQETAIAAHQTLQYLAGQILGDEALEPETDQVLRKIVSGRPPEAREALEEWQPRNRTLSPDSQPVRLMKDPAFELVITELADNFMGLTPVSTEPGRQVLKYSYVTELP